MGTTVLLASDYAVLIVSVSSAVTCASWNKGTPFTLDGDLGYQHSACLRMAHRQLVRQAPLMDEGLAALIAGVAGAIGGIGGGTAGAYFTGRAMVRQVRDQATTEHGHWLREQRMQAYLTLLQEWDAAHRGLKDIWTRAVEAFYEDSLNILHGDLDDMCNAALDQVDGVIAPTFMAFERVGMLGPDEIDDAALGLEMALQDLRSVVETRLGPHSLTTAEAMNWEPWNDSDAAASGARQNFALCVRGVLGEPPTPASTGD